MPESVDNRLVKMTFDNASFERKLNDTIRSIDKLEKSLQFEKSQRGLQELAKTTKKFELGNMATHIDGVSKKFLALSTIAVTSLAQITKAAISAGVNLTKSLSLDLVLDGFKEYTGNINSIQTILANTQSKGSTLEDVTKALDELNEFSDQTIYNFGQMTRNIGTFTAAGVDLETSVKSIKGIASLAAISGSSSEQAANAMYQLSQAISTGTLKLIDWNSVVNAGLGGEVFQTALFETGKALKTIKDIPMDMTFKEWTKAGNTFRGSLEDGWITGEVLTTTLQNFTGDLTRAQILAKGYTEDQADEIERLGKLGFESATKVRTLTQLLQTVKESIGSGWAQSFRIIFGDFEEATELFTEISDAIGNLIKNAARARNELLQGWKDLGGRMLLLKGLKDAFKALADVLKPIKQAFRDVFPKTTSKRLYELTKSFIALVERMKPSEKTIVNLRRTFAGFFQVVKIGVEIVKGVGNVIRALFSKFIGTGKILQATADFSLFLAKLRLFLVEGGRIKDFFNIIIDAIKNPGPYLEKLRDLFMNVFNDIKSIIKNPVPFLEDLKDRVLNFLSALPGLGGLKNIDLPNFDFLGDVLDRLSHRFEQARAAAEFFFDIFKSIKERLDKVRDTFVKIFNGVLDFLKDWFSGLGTKLAADLSPHDFDAAVDALNVGLLAALTLLFKKFIDEGLQLDFGGGLMRQFSGLVDQVTKALGQLTGTLKAMETSLKADAVMKIAIAIGILAASLLVLSLIDSVDLTRALTAMAVGFGELATTTAIIAKMSIGPATATGFAIMAAAMISIASAMLVFATAVAAFGAIDPENIGRGLGAISVSLGLMIVTVRAVAGLGPSVILAAAAIGMIAVALNIMAGAVAIFSTLSWESIGKGLAAVAGLLLAIGIALSFIPPSAPLVAAGILLTAIALNVMAAAMLIFAELDWGEIGRGLVAMAGGLLILAVGLTAMVAAAPGAVALAIATPALAALAGVMMLFGQVSWAEIGKGLLVISALLIVLAVGLTAMVLALPGAAALIVAAVGLGVMVEVLAVLAAIKLGDLIKGLLAISAIFVVLGVAAHVLGPLVPVLFALGGAMTFIGLGFALFGAGALLVAQAIQILAAVSDEGMDAIFTLLDGLIERLPKMLTVVATTILKMATTLVEGFVPLIDALAVVLGHFLEKLTGLLPQAAKFIGELIDELTQLIIDKSPEIIEAGFQLFMNFLKGIEDHIYEIVDLVGDIIVEFFKALKRKVPEIQAAGFAFIIEYLRGIQRNLNKLITAGVDIIVAFLKGIAKAIGRVNRAGGDIIIELIEGFGRNINRVVRKGTDVLVKFLEGLGTSGRRLINAAGKLILDILDAIGDAVDLYLPQIRKAGIRIVGEMIDGMTLGILDHAPGFLKNFLGISKEAEEQTREQLESHSPSRVFMRIGQDMVAGMVLAFDKDTTMATSAQGFADRTTKAIMDAMRSVSSDLVDINEFNPTIKPVLDLSTLKTDAKQISTFMSVPDLAPAFTQAKELSALQLQALQDNVPEDTTTPQATEIKFEQNITAPTPLSTKDIYRNTRNQLIIAKEELKIP